MTPPPPVNADLVELADPTAAVIVGLGCGGATMAALRCANPTGRFIGIEAVPEQAAAARQHCDSVIEADIETADGLAELDRVLGADPIGLLVIDEALTQLNDPGAVLTRLHRRMAANGRLVLSLPNVAHWSVILGQVKGEWRGAGPDRAGAVPRHHFTRRSAIDLLTAAGWHRARSRPRKVETPQARMLIEALQAVAPGLGVQPARLQQDLSAARWVHCAAAAPQAAPHRIHAIGIATALDSLSTVRLRQPLDSLRGMGRAEYVLYRGTFQLPEPDGAPGILLTYRFHPGSDEQWDRLERLIAQGWLFIHDVDDHPAYLKAQKRNGFRSIREAHAVTVSTPALARVCRQWNCNTHVVPNQIASLAPRHLALACHDRPKVFLGGLNRTDQWDDGVRQAVLTTLREDGFQTTVIADPAFGTEVGDAGLSLPVLNYDDYRARLAGADIALLPLRPDEFTDCKSDLKIIECLASGVVPLCSAFAAQRSEVPRHLLVAAETPQDWSRALVRLRDSDLRADLQEAGYDWVGRNRMWSGAAPALDALYKSLFSQRAKLDAGRSARMRAAI